MALTACQDDETPPGRDSLRYFPAAESPAVTSSEASRMNAITPTIPKDSRRRRSVAVQGAPGAGLTFQIALSDSCSWPNTPEAPMSSVITPITVATNPAWGRLAAPWTIAMIACEPPLPATPEIASRISRPPLSPKNRPARPIEITSSGAIENTV